ncbi:MAG: DUF86 domain-containing protein [Euryarchaeota archaeon]|nr:DUF86 domain-containing protein [Euryarchaeota archaeon]
MCIDKMAPPGSESETYALFYLVHTSVEAAMDVVAMLVKDLGGVPKDDYSNISWLQQMNLLRKELAECLRKLNGMRNILVHRYNKVEERLVVESLEEIKACLRELVEAAKNALGEAH